MTRELIGFPFNGRMTLYQFMDFDYDKLNECDKMG